MVKRKSVDLLDLSGSAKIPRVQRRWNSKEEDEILAYMKCTITSGRKINEPTGDEYCRRMMSKLALVDCSLSQLKNKMKNFKDNYTKTIQWRDQTGQGVMADFGETTFKEATLKRCPRFYELDEIYSEKLNINPPFVFNSPLPAVDDVDEANVDSSHQSPAVNDADQDTGATGTPTPIVQPSTSFQPTQGGRKPQVTPKSSGLAALADARNMKTTFDNRKLDVDVLKLEFEKEKWEAEMKLKEKELDLEKIKIENSSQNARYEIELKYQTQLEIAKLTSQRLDK